jgi:four helix bundle protein
MAHKLEELPIFQDAQRFCSAVSETLARSRLRKNSNAYAQLEDANDSILANMDEGFAQESDDGFSKYLYYSKGSVAEVMRRLHRAAQKGLVDRDEVNRLEAMAEPLGKQCGGFIKYLKRSGFKDRGRFRFDGSGHNPSED